MVDEGGHNRAAPLIAPDFPNQVPVPTIQQIRPLLPPGKAAVQKAGPVEKCANPAVSGRGKNIQHHLTGRTLLDFQPEGAALLLEVLYQRGNQGLVAEPSHSRSCQKPAQNPQGLREGRGHFPLHKGAEDGVLKLVKAGLPLSPKFRQTSGHIHGADFIVGGEGKSALSQTPSRPHQEIQNRLVPWLLLSLRHHSPDPVVESGGRHPAGIAV